MILVAENLTKTFSRQNRQFEAVSHVNFSMDAGEIAVLTGPSGCGKSTFFHLVTGITAPDEGEIRFMGQQINKKNAKERADIRAKEISYILQGDSLLGNLNVMENICFPSLMNGIREDLTNRAMELLENFGMENFAYEYPKNLSGGEKRRVAIARAFVHAPKLVVADEPTSDLDEENTQIILDFFEKQRDMGTSILISTHDLSCLRPGMTHYIMHNGVIDREA